MAVVTSSPSALRVAPRSFWLEEALRADPGAPCPSLSGTHTADVCVIGGGFAGLWTAYELHEREPSLDIVLLEADVCGAGGSGANGGFLSSSWHDIEALCRFFGEDEGIRYASALAAQIGEVDAWCRRHDAHVELHAEGVVFLRAGEWEPEPAESPVRLLERRGLAGKLLIMSGEEVRQVVDSPTFVGGTAIDDVATVQPARLARELRRVLLERGVRICEGTPMTSLRTGVPVAVGTPSGKVRCETAVVTTGAWAAAAPPFRRAFYVAVDSVVITEPVPELLADMGWDHNVGFADDRESFYYVRRTDDGRVAIGGGHIGIAADGRMDGRVFTDPEGAEIAAGGLRWLFPTLRDVRITHAWTGPMDMTASLTPFFMSSPDGTVHVGLGFSGHGLTATRVGGKTLASMVLGLDDEWSSLPVVGPPMSALPPEPFRQPLLSLFAGAVVRSEQAQQAGGRATPAGRLASAVFRAHRRRQRPGP